MSYKFATEQQSYEDYASGRVLYNQQGTTSFPVRLASEIFQRSVSLLQEDGYPGPYSVYDPCCGGSYLLTVVGFLHGNAISALYASDINETVISLAQKNLSLLSSEGLAVRIHQIETMVDMYGKISHQEALASAQRLQDLLASRKHTIVTECFIADATQRLTELAQLTGSIEMVMTDLPYGELVEWSEQQEDRAAVPRLLENLLPLLAPQAVVAIIAPKKTKVQHEAYQRVERFSLGKRQIVLLRPTPLK